VNRHWTWANLALSRYPILTEEHLDFAGDGSRPVQQRFTLKVDGQIIAVYNVHLAMPLGDTPRLPGDQYILQTLLRFDDTIRNTEIRRLLVQLEKEPFPFIVAGDFNLSDQAATYRDLTAHMSDTFREVGIGLGGSWPISVAGEFPSFMPPLVRIDYVWHSGHFRAVDAQQGPRMGSDHLPLYVTLELWKSSP
jgi:vancomycin resistance protein VanJ